jgi:predicted nucleotidyltransferase
MRPTYTVESIFGTRGRVQVLRVLNGVRVPLNAAQIARQAGLTRAGAAAALRDLENMGLVLGSQVGWARAYLLERDNEYVRRIVAPAFSGEESIPEALENDLLQAFDGVSSTVVIFGSYARGEQRSDSDVDVVLISADPASTKAVDDRYADLVVEFSQRWGAPLSVLVYSPREAATLQDRSPGLFGDLVKDALLVKGEFPSLWRKTYGGAEVTEG